MFKSSKKNIFAPKDELKEDNKPPCLTEINNLMSILKI